MSSLLIKRFCVLFYFSILNKLDEFGFLAIRKSLKAKWLTFLPWAGEENC
jgi:hypothetical protein